MYNTSKKRNKRKPTSDEDKIKLSGFIKDEDVIHNLKNKLHANKNAVSAAWMRVAKKMDRSVDDCRAIYKSIRDSLRHKHKKVCGKSGDSGDEMFFGETGCSELNDALAFLTPTSSKFPRSTIIMGGTEEETKSLSEGESSSAIYKYASKRGSNTPDALEASVSDLTKTLSTFVQQNSAASKSELKFEYIWKNLDVLFQKLSEDDVVDLNQQFITMTCEKIKSVSLE
ncbi:uncharacterized protein LOC129950384 [Eupeodes corollae]|uniref:uncharacterized protein LOC129950384 n=1 Tax=Eupeodes corollae TaxID=290404 RepID=UPI00248FA7A0|nr:uncharacterized protein LOC129950384 [Eupeodes corollae]